MAVNDGDGLWHLKFGRMGTSVTKERHVTGDRMLIAYRLQSSTNELRAGVANCARHPLTHQSKCAEWTDGPEVLSEVRCWGGGGEGCIRVLKDHATW